MIKHKTMLPFATGLSPIKQTMQSPNTSIPASSAEDVTESGKPLAKSEGVKFTKIENGRALCELQSGSYRFESKLEEKQR